MAAYFTQDLFQFFTELQQHNEREWFQANKARYEDSVKEPFLQLLSDLAEPFQHSIPHYTIDARAVGGSMFRINRDTRFSHDKSPYKTHVAAHFVHAELGKKAVAPGFYINLGPDGCFIGGGIWQPPTPVLTHIRQAIVAEPDRWQHIKQQGTTGMGCTMMSSESLKKVPAGFPIDHRFADDLRRKDFGLSHALSNEEVLGDDLINTLLTRFQCVSPMVQFLCDAMGVQF